MAEQDQQQGHHAGSCEQSENKKSPWMTWWLASPGLLLTIAGVIGSASHIGDNAYCSGAILLGGLLLTVALCLHKEASWSIDAELKSSATFILIIGIALSLVLALSAIILFPLPLLMTRQGIEIFFSNSASIAKVLAGGAALAAFYATMHRSSQTQTQIKQVEERNHGDKKNITKDLHSKLAVSISTIEKEKGVLNNHNMIHAMTEANLNDPSQKERIEKTKFKMLKLIEEDWRCHLEFTTMFISQIEEMKIYSDLSLSSINLIIEIRVNSLIHKNNIPTLIKSLPDDDLNIEALKNLSSLSNQAILSSSRKFYQLKSSLKEDKERLKSSNQ